MGITHFDEAPSREVHLAHLRGRWTLLGEAAGSSGVGLRRIEILGGAWSTPAHEHGRSEEIFYVLSGSGHSWHAGQCAEIGPGDAILYAPRTGPHTVHASEDLDLLAFGTRDHDEAPRFPQLGMSLLGGRSVASGDPIQEDAPVQFQREAEHGPPQLPSAPDPRPPTIINLDELEPVTMARTHVERRRRNLGGALGSVRTGLQYVEVVPGKESSPQHCHSIEEEMFVILAGDGNVVLDDIATPVRPGHVISRPPATGISHLFAAGENGLTYLAYGTRDPGDICYYPRSNKIAFRGVGLVARLEKLDYWDGED